MERCEFCCQPATSICTICDTSICSRHAAGEHISDFPRITHNIIPLSSADLSFTATPTKDLHFQKVVLIESRYDIYETFRIFKWGISGQETFEMLNTIRSYNAIKVVGIYGSLNESLDFAKELLECPYSLKHMFLEQREGIISLFQPATESLCLIYVAETEDLYTQKPFPQDSQKTIFLQLLMDLCPIIVCCPSSTLIRNWYSSQDAKRANPFVSATHNALLIRVKLLQTSESDIEKLEVHLSADIYLTSDNQPFIFTIESNQQQRKCQSTIVIKTYLLTMASRELRINEICSQQFLCDCLLKESYLYSISSETSYFFFNSDSMQGLKFNHKGQARKSVPLPTLPLNSVLASGSSISLFALFINSQEKAYYGSARDEIGIADGYDLKVYGEQITNVLAACLQPVKREIYLINHEGQLFIINLMSPMKALHRVTGTDKHILSPHFGTRFFKVQSSKCESLLYLQSESGIEIYKVAPMMLAKYIQTQGIEMQYKILTMEKYEVILIKNRDKVEAYRFQTETQGVENEIVIKRTKEDIAGNPIVDIIQYANLKYGPVKHASGSIWFYFRIDNKNSEIERYCTRLPVFSAGIEWKGLLTNSNYSSFVSNWKSLSSFRVEVEHFKWSLLTRSCIHLACIQQGNLLPLKDGFVTVNIRNMEDIRFGILEDILAKVGKLKVVSIMGKQSSGKSYLLNRLFHSRFDVSAARCTEGIWLSLSYIEGQIFVVLDCEGLFSSERKPIEETKMCLFLAAISDVTILNCDLSFNRYISKVFDQSSKFEGLLSKPSLFRGALEFAIRDVPQHQDSGAIEETLGYLHRLSKSDFLFQLFHGIISITSYPNFELKEQFAFTIIQQQMHYLNEMEQRWLSGQDLLHNMKAVLEYMAGSGQNDDPAAQGTMLDELANTINDAIFRPEELCKLLRPYEFQFATDLPLLKMDTMRIVDLNTIELTHTSSLDIFEEKLRSITSLDPETVGLRIWNMSLKTLIDDYFAALRLLSINYLYEKAHSLAPSYLELMKDKAEQIGLSIDNTLWKKFRFCEGKCQDCYLTCSFPANHESVCSCSTTHKCTEICPDCPFEEICEIPAGHREEHHCERNHDARLDLTECSKSCILSRYCGNKCGINASIQHEIHNCKQKFCPFNCSMPGCQIQCGNEDHIHSVRSRYFFLILQFFPKETHFCNDKHKCTDMCINPGNCLTQIHSERKKCRGFMYTHISQEAIKLPCSYALPPRQQTHRIHFCEAQIHTCNVICHDCGVYCSLQYPHQGPHKAESHISKTRCCTWAPTPQFQYEIQDEFVDITRRFSAGDRSSTETCEACCIRKGRGHAHPVRCVGNKNCLARSYPQSAIHSNGFYPDINANIDLVECSKYWEIKNWIPPLVANPNALNLFRLCPYYCGSGALKAYCSKSIFHSTSPLPQDHSITLDADVVFLVDSTASMKREFQAVKDTIEATMRGFRTSHPALTFTIITYIDHWGGPASVVEVCPATCRTSEYNLGKAVAFVQAMRTRDTGNAQRGEITHAIYTMSRMKWRDSAYRLVYYFTKEGDIGTKYCVCAGSSQTAEIRPLLDEYTKVNKVEIASRPANAPDLTKKIVEDLYGSAKRDPFTLELADKYTH